MYNKRVFVRMRKRACATQAAMREVVRVHNLFRLFIVSLSFSPFLYYTYILLRKFFESGWHIYSLELYYTTNIYMYIHIVYI